MADIKIAGRIKAGAADNIAGYASEILFDDQASNKTVKEKIEEVASSPQTMIVTITPDGNDGYEADKTFAEIAAFIDNGGTVIAKDEEDGDSYYYLDNYIASEVVFCRNIWGSNGFTTRSYTIDNTNTVTFDDSLHFISSDVNSSSTANLANSAAVKALHDSMSEIKSISVNNTEQQVDQEGNVDIAVPDSLADLAGDSTHRTVTDAEKTTWNGKQNALTFDNVPTANSNNPVKSSGIKTALDAKQDTISTVNVTVDNNTGTPSGSASVSGSTLSLSFQNLKGETGATGATGPQGPQGERGLPGESGVTGDVSGFTVIQTIDPSATYGATDIAGAATVQATNEELTELAGEVYTYSFAWETVTGFTTGKYIKTSQGVGNSCPMTTTTLSSMDCIKIAATAGETYRIVGVGGANPLLWATVDSSTSKILAAFDAYTGSQSVPFDEIVEIQQDCWLIINVYNSTASPAYYNSLLTPYSLKKGNESSRSSRIDPIEESVVSNTASIEEMGSRLDVLYKLTAMSPSATTSGWELTGDSTIAQQQSSSSLLKYQVTAGDVLYLKLSKDNGGVYQFQSAEAVNSSNLVGEQVTTAIDGEVTVPTGATYLIVSQLNSNQSNKVYSVTGKVASQSSIIEDISNTGITGNEEVIIPVWELGTWVNSAHADSTTRIRNKGIDVLEAGTYVFSIDSGYQFYLYVDGQEYSFRTYAKITLAEKSDIQILLRLSSNASLSGYVPSEFVAESGFKIKSNISTIEHINNDIANINGLLYNESVGDTLPIGDDTTIIATRRSYMLKYGTEDGVDYLYFSDDLGNTWTSLQNTYGNIVHAHWFNDGTCLFCTEQHCYYTKDFVTVNESTVYDYDGTVSTPSGHRFYNPPKGIDSYMVDGKEFHLWYDYFVGSNSNPRLWYSNDYGVTVRAAFAFGESSINGTVLTARHGHGFKYNPYNNYFYAWTGDAASDCHIIRGKCSNNTWTWERVATGIEYKLGTIIFKGGNMFCVTDYTDGSLVDKKGLIRCPVDNVDSNNFEYLYKATDLGSVALSDIWVDKSGWKIMVPDYIGGNRTLVANKGFNFKWVTNLRPIRINGFTGPNYNGDIYCKYATDSSVILHIMRPTINLTEAMRNFGAYDFSTEVEFDSIVW